ncbi:hypothetical protein TNCV_3156221 [Trichonephila clavipes]|nr:hypothetical protein TNCV_3156221 [Trichonephila clavipes]
MQGSNMPSSSNEQRDQVTGIKRDASRGRCNVIPLTSKVGRESAEDDERSERPQTSHTTENIEKVSAPKLTFSPSRSEVTTGIPFTLTMYGFSYPKGDKGNKRFW